MSPRTPAMRVAQAKANAAAIMEACGREDCPGCRTKYAALNELIAAVRYEERREAQEGTVR